MQYNRDRQNNNYNDYPREREYRNGEYRGHRQENDYGYNRYAEERSRHRDAAPQRNRDQNDRSYNRDRYHEDTSYRGGAIIYRDEDYRSRGQSSNIDRAYGSNRDYMNPERYRNSRTAEGYDDSGRSFRGSRSYREYPEYDRPDASGDYRREHNQNYDYRQERYNDRNRGTGRYADDDRNRDYERRAPASVKDKYSSSSLHYRGITSIGEEYDSDRDRNRYQGSHYVARNNSDRNYAGSGMGSSYRHRF